MKIHFKDLRGQEIFFICKLWSCCIIHGFMVTHKQSAHGVGFIYISSNRPRPSWLHVTFLCNISRDFIFYFPPCSSLFTPVALSPDWLRSPALAGHSLPDRPLSLCVLCTLVVTSSVKVKNLKGISWGQISIKKTSTYFNLVTMIWLFLGILECWQISLQGAWWQKRNKKHPHVSIQWRWFGHWIQVRNMSMRCEKSAPSTWV